MDEGQWHLSKSVPISFIFALLVQTAAALWWASAINYKVEELQTTMYEFNRNMEAENLRQWARINANEDSVGQAIAQGNLIAELLRRVEADVKDIDREIESISKFIREGSN